MRVRRAVTLTVVAAVAFTVAVTVALLAAAGWPSRPVGLPVLSGLAAGFLAALILGGRLADTLERSLRQIAAAARSGAEGHLRPAREGSLAEAREAAAAFNAMVTRVTRTIADLGTEKSTLESVLAHMSDGLLIVGADGTLTLVNPPAERIFGITVHQAVGHRFIEVIHHFELDALLRQVERERVPLSHDVEVHYPEHRLLRVQVNPVSGHAGQFLGTVIVAQDITDLRRVDLVRQEFVANVSHELRTPLTSLRALAETLQEGAIHDSDASPRFLGRMISEIDRLTLLVNDLLDLSAIESGSAKLEMAPVPLTEVIEEVVAKFRPVAERRGIALRVERENGLPPAWGDRDRLTQAVTNLVDNAVKYTPEGGAVTVSGRDQGPLVAVSVTDTGIGIAPEHLPRIFERFYRVDRSRSRALGGTGLGLSIVKHIATSHGGRVEVQSSEGRGSRFTLLVPHAPDGTPSRS
jgi:two-component system, OmpR family, phosphate regulon sensor histidine kinase PhoR